MNLKLYDGKSIKLTPFISFRERLKYVEDNVLNKDKYEKFYNISSINLNPIEYKEIINRWLGIKVVNKPNKVETLKSTLNFITGYILGNHDYSIKKKVKRYNELKNKKTLTKDEIDEFAALSKNVLFDQKVGHRDIVFYINTEAENLIKYNIHNGIKSSDYTCRFMIEDLKYRLAIIDEAKDKCLNLVGTLSNNNIEINSLKQIMQSEFKNIKNNKSKVNDLLQIAKQIKTLKNENEFIKNQISDLQDSYFVATEYIYKN